MGGGVRPWSTGDAGSFAHRTLAVRVPKILDDTVAQNPSFHEDIRARCAALRAELTGGRLRGLLEETPDRAAWDVACAPHVGKSWLDVPWYFAESFFYRRVLEAVRFFETGEDPFLAVKLSEERRALPRARPLVDARPPLPALLHAALWGNRADLSYTAGLAHGDRGDAGDLLVDDTAAAVELLGGRTAILLDNAGTELCFDLLLADTLGAVLFAKAHPFFVSDATPADVERTRAALGLPARELLAHPYMTSSGFLSRRDMPADLTDALASFDAVVVKGDANYRRLVGDAPWPVDTPFASVVDFPAPVVALRTLKAEVALGIERPPADADWMVSGRYAVIQSSRPKGP